METSAYTEVTLPPRFKSRIQSAHKAISADFNSRNLALNANTITSLKKSQIMSTGSSFKQNRNLNSYSFYNYNQGPSDMLIPEFHSPVKGLEFSVI